MFSQVDLGNNTGIFHSHPGHIIQEQDGLTIRIENKSRQEHFYAWQTGDVIKIVRIVNNLICSDIEPVVTEIQANYESTEILSQYVSILLNLSTETLTNQSDWVSRYTTTPFPLQLEGGTLTRILNSLHTNVWNQMATYIEGDVVVADEDNAVWANNETAVAEIDRDMMSRTRELGEQIRRRCSEVSDVANIPTEFEDVTDGPISTERWRLALEALRGERESNSSPRGGGDEPVSGGRLPEHERLDEYYEAQEQYDILEAKLQPQEEDQEKPDYSDTSEVDDLIATMKGLIDDGDEDGDE